MLETLEGDTVATVVIAFLVAGIFKGTLGMGCRRYPLQLGVAIGLREAIPVLMIPSFLANLWQSNRPGPVMPLFKHFGMMNRQPVVDDPFVSHRPVIINSLFGSVVILYALLNLTRLDFTLEPGHEPLFGPPVDFFSGLLSGVSGSLLLPVAVNLRALKLDKDTFVQAVGLSLFIGTVIWAISFHSEGGMTADIWILPAIAVPPILVSMVISQ